MLVTPEVAKTMLAKNTNNYRKINSKVVDQYASDMKHGRWVDNGETIVFDEDGNLKNGQHRLTAIVRSGVSLMLTVVSGVDRNINNYDQHFKRTLSQFMTAEGLPSTLRLPYITGAVRCLLNGGFLNTIATNSEVCSAITSDSDAWMTVGKLCDEKHNNYGILCVSRNVSFAITLYMALKDGFLVEDLRDCVNTCNSGMPSKLHDSTSAIVFRNMAIKSKSVYSREHKMLLFSASYQALRDYLHDVRRTKPYMITRETELIFNQFSNSFKNIYTKEQDK